MQSSKEICPDYFCIFALSMTLPQYKQCSIFTCFFLQVPDWSLINEGAKLKLTRSWKVKTFTKGLEFFQTVANVAEAEGIEFCVPIYCESTMIRFCNRLYSVVDGWITLLSSTKCYAVRRQCLMFSIFPDYNCYRSPSRSASRGLEQCNS